MKIINFLIIFLVTILSYGVRAECPYSIKDATVMLTLPDETNMKISSSYMCNQKAYLADRFFDAEVEVWKKGKLVGKFYSRKVAYDLTSLKLMLQNTAFLGSEIIEAKKFKNTNLVFVDLKKGKLNTSAGEIRF